MRKSIYYVFNYSIIMILGHFILNIYNLPEIAILCYNTLAISFGIKYKISKRKDVSKKEVLKYLLILTTIFNFGLIYVLKLSFTKGSVLILSNIIQLNLFKVKKEELEFDTKRKIEEYFSKKK